MLSSCFGFGRGGREDEREPLLPRYNDDTSLQRRVHQKLHTYQMLRALSKGFMPSNEQLIANLRTLLASDVLTPDRAQTKLSDSGQALVHYTRQWITQFIELLQHKNSNDQIQDFIWYLTKARVSVDVEDIAERASRAKAKADTAAVYRSLQTVGSLLLTNSDFRLFLGDLGTVAREVFKDTAFALSEAAKEAGKQIEPSSEDQAALKQGGNSPKSPPSQQDLADQTAELSKVLSITASTVVDAAGSSVAQKLEGPEKDTLIHRLKDTVVNLRRRRDYSESVSTLSLLLKRYAMVYSRAAEDTLQVVDEDVDRNQEMDRALRNFWLFLSSFGEAKEWAELEERFRAVMRHTHEDSELEDLAGQLGSALEEMLTDPSFFDHAEQRFQDLRARAGQMTSHSSLRDDIDGLLSQLQTTLRSAMSDRDVAGLRNTSAKIAKIFSPRHQYVNSDLMADAINVFGPLLVQSINYIPIPRLEISAPQLDLLLENLILEPGRTINQTSFFPYRLRVETLNDIEIRKARFRTTSAIKTLVRIRMDGLSIRGEEVGYWLRLHSGLFLRLADEGIASFALDERGIDIQLDVEVGRDSMDKILSLRGVKVRIHKLNWTLRKSKFSFFSWLLKPFIRPIIRKTIESYIATSIRDALRAANRELVFARERLRATRVADPDDLRTFVRAVMARFTPPEDADLHARVGIEEPGRGVFEGVDLSAACNRPRMETGLEGRRHPRSVQHKAMIASKLDQHITSPAADYRRAEFQSSPLLTESTDPTKKMCHLPRRRLAGLFLHVTELVFALVVAVLSCRYIDDELRAHYKPEGHAIFSALVAAVSLLMAAVGASLLLWSQYSSLLFWFHLGMALFWLIDFVWVMVVLGRRGCRNPLELNEKIHWDHSDTCAWWKAVTLIAFMSLIAWLLSALCDGLDRHSKKDSEIQEEREINRVREICIGIAELLFAEACVTLATWYLKIAINMSNIVHKVENAMGGKKASAPEGTYGPHGSRAANAMDPRVDSDRDNSRTMGATGTTGTGRTAGHGELGSSGFGAGRTGMTGTHGTSEGTYGPHSSRVANAMDPRVDSDRDNSRTMGAGTTGGMGTGSRTAGGLGSSTTGMTGTHGTSEGTYGPHSSRVANAMDPRVDSDRDNSRTMGAGTTGGMGTGSRTAGGLGSSTTGMTGTHGTSEGTYGPHSSRVANAMDDNSRTMGGTTGGLGTGTTHTAGVGGSGVTGTHKTTGATHGLHGSRLPGPAKNTAGPHKSDLLNKLDPRVDSDPDGSRTMGQDKTYQPGNTPTARRDPTDAAQVPPSVLRKHVGEPIVEHDDVHHHRARRNSVKSHQEAFSGV
ncbi:hypothetical protein VTJ49DRAFT_476 [Mycothermus thermophilus]|uniref:HAM1-like N-terminal domain-containing protein n=1 Tax=Humicola insolens TaxID=85995 RepID=A0ABR3VGM1_HUMIN